MGGSELCMSQQTFQKKQGIGTIFNYFWTQPYEGNFMLSAMWCFELNLHDNQEAELQKSQIITRGAIITYKDHPHMSAGKN